MTVAADVDGDTVRADKRRMVRVLANLIDNARPYGGGASMVSVEHVKGNGRRNTWCRSRSRTAGRASRPRSAP